MSSLPDTQAAYSPAALLALARDFDRDSVGNRQRIADILQYQPEVFYHTAIEILGIDITSRASQYILGLLISAGWLFRALVDPALDRQRASELARHAQAGDPAVHVQLARQLADTCASIAPGMAERMLEILDQFSDIQHLLPSLMRMLRTDNPYLRSKAVLMIGRSGRSLNWIKKSLQESDTRVRANAIEAVWGIDTPEARELLVWAARDGNNRVVGNALLGLYRLGESSSVADLVKMAAHDSPAFRRTAAWAMGETGDSRFTEVLGRMIGDASSQVRKNAFEEVRRVRAGLAQASQTPRWPVAAAAGPKDPRSGERRVALAVAGADSRESPRVLPAQFILTENGQTVWSYRVTEKMAPGPMSVSFLFPRNLNNSWQEGTLQCLAWKRSSDQWSTVPYSDPEDRPSQPSVELELPRFISNSAKAVRPLQQTPRRSDCTGFWTAIQRAVLPSATARGQRHMIVLAQDEVGGSADEDLVEEVRASRTSIQVVSTSANMTLREFCRRVDGQFHHLKDDSTVEESVSLAYLSLLARYEIRYQPVIPDAASLKIRVQTPSGWGETTVEW